MYHSITFSDFSNPNDKANTWDDWHLIPYPRPHVAPPQPNFKTVEIPGMNGIVNLSKVLTGYTTYKNRTGQWDFYVDNDHWPWATAYSAIMMFVHGKLMKCTLEDDPDYYYYGTLAVDNWSSDKTHSRISIKYNFYPYKKDIYTSLDDWLWDPFNFETGVIHNSARNISVASEEKTFMVVGTDDPGIPELIVSSVNGSLTVKSRWLDGPNPDTYSSTHTITQVGSYRYPDLKIRKGRNEFAFNGNGVVSIDYRGGIL